MNAEEGLNWRERRCASDARDAGVGAGVGVGIDGVWDCCCECEVGEASLDVGGVVVDAPIAGLELEPDGDPLGRLELRGVRFVANQR